MGVDQYIKVKQDVCEGVIASLPGLRSQSSNRFLSQFSIGALAHIEQYTDAALDMENTLREKMQCLSSHEFEQLVGSCLPCFEPQFCSLQLHPVFEEDEWKLILMGGVLGL